MSHPDPNNPYGQPPQGQPQGYPPQGQPYGQPPQGQPPQGQPYGYPQQPPAAPPGYGYPQQPPAGTPGYGYPQQPPSGQPDGYPQQPPAGPPGYGYPQQQPGHPYGAYPGGPDQMPVQMPGTVKTARVLLFVVGGLNVLAALLLAVAGAALQSGEVSTADTEGLSGGLLFFMAVISAALAVAAIVIAAKFGKGGNGVRVGAIVVGSLIIASGAVNVATGNAPSIVGLAIGVLVVVFSAKQDAKMWFNRPRY
jgi:hypothetical protein